MNKKFEIKNRRAEFDYQIVDKYVAGLMLKGTEIKALREGKGSITEAFCFIRDGELFIRGMHIPEYSQGNLFNHEAVRMRKLLLTRREINRLSAKVKEKGFTIAPLRIFEGERGWAKIEIALVKGKKSFDKRESIKAKDSKREMDRVLKKYK